MLPDAMAPWRVKAQRVYEGIVEFWSVFYNPMAKRVMEGDAPDCFVKSFLQSPNVDSFSESERRVLFSDILAAGQETTATTLRFFFKAALLYPEFIKHAQAELDQVVGDDRLPDWNDRPNLPYLKAVITELHRWASTTPLGFYRATSDDDTYRGSSIAASTTVIYNTYAVHHSEQYFAQHEKFIPERYLQESDERRMANGVFAPVHYAFGTGRRECPAKYVAEASLYIAISRLLWAFDIELGPNPPPGDGIGKSQLRSLQTGDGTQLTTFTSWWHSHPGTGKVWLQCDCEKRKGEGGNRSNELGKRLYYTPRRCFFAVRGRVSESWEENQNLVAGLELTVYMVGNQF
jgi:cytochrome P450